MSRETINLICSELPGAERSDPWGGGHDAWKVGGKMFACIGAVTPGVSVKTAGVDEAEMLIAAGIGTRAAYFHRSWITLPFESPELELRHRIVESYEIVRKSLPQKVQVTLDRTSG
jgi:predicted DNA-binding protein (MmcQ/YjbR family)